MALIFRLVIFVTQVYAFTLAGIPRELRRLEGKKNHRVFSILV